MLAYDSNKIQTFTRGYISISHHISSTKQSIPNVAMFVGDKQHPQLVGLWRSAYHIDLNPGSMWFPPVFQGPMAQWAPYRHINQFASIKNRSISCESLSSVRPDVHLWTSIVISLRRVAIVP